MSKKAEDAYAEALKIYDAMVAAHPDVERKGKANPYTSLNGHMFSFLSKEGQIALRLPKEERERFLEEFDTELAVSYNTVMKEYVVVPPKLLAKKKELKKYFQMSYEFVGQLFPKASKPNDKT